MSIARLFPAVMILTASIFDRAAGLIPPYVKRLGIFVALLFYFSKLYKNIYFIVIASCLNYYLLILSVTLSSVSADTVRFALPNVLPLLFAIHITRSVSWERFTTIMLSVCGVACGVGLASGQPMGAFAPTFMVVALRAASVRQTRAQAPMDSGRAD